MRHPPSPLLLSARKRRPRRNPPRGAQLAPAGESADATQPRSDAAGSDKCALLEPDPSGESDTPDRGRGSR